MCHHLLCMSPTSLCQTISSHDADSVTHSFYKICLCINCSKIFCWPYGVIKTSCLAISLSSSRGALRFKATSLFERVHSMVLWRSLQFMTQCLWLRRCEKLPGTVQQKYICSTSLWKVLPHYILVYKIRVINLAQRTMYKMADMLHTTSSNVSSWIKTFVFWSKLTEQRHSSQSNFSNCSLKLDWKYLLSQLVKPVSHKTPFHSENYI